MPSTGSRATTATAMNTHLDDTEHQCRHDVAQRGGDRVHVGRAAGGEVTGRHPFDHGRRQGERTAQKALPDPGGGPLAEPVRDGQRGP